MDFPHIDLLRFWHFPHHGIDKRLGITLKGDLQIWSQEAQDGQDKKMHPTAIIKASF